MLIRLIIYGFLIYFGYYVFKSFKAIRKAAEQNIRNNKVQNQKKSKISKNDAEELDYEEVDK